MRNIIEYRSGIIKRIVAVDSEVKNKLHHTTTEVRTIARQRSGQRTAVGYSEFISFTFAAGQRAGSSYATPLNRSRCADFNESGNWPPIGADLNTV